MEAPLPDNAEATLVSSPPPPPRIETGLRSRSSVAPAWHTGLLLLLLLVLSLAGAHSKHQSSLAHGRVPLYITSIAVEWLMFVYVVFGIRRRNVSLRELIAGRWQSLEDALIDVVIGVGFWFAALMVLGALGYAMGMVHPGQMEEAKQKIGFLAPRGPLELQLFLLLSVTAGICEEVIFRGYLQRQFAALTRTAIGGAVLQAAVFGCAHAYEGKSRMLLLAVFGAMFSMLALARNSLRPGMLAHFLHDGVAGIVMSRVLR